ncbi:hypothetical protein F5Y11DRAFT_364547 [Daldinia sp. FL1419]|nr:hypothetical protein F5Y11DRAFT_364547 [Daldinia sp. FL1419]
MQSDSLPDYLKNPSRPTPSSHNRIGKHIEHSTMRTSYGGFPAPGEQNPTPTSVMAQEYFVDDATWDNILAHGKFDYIVIGSGFTALAFITETLKNDENKRILCIERGGFLLPSHFQNLPLPFKLLLGGPSETFPWTLSGETFKTKDLGYCHGYYPFFGGRSTFWSAWCPQPDKDLMRDFPPELIKPTEEKGFWSSAKELLNVTIASKIGNDIFSKLQNSIEKILKDHKSNITSAKSVESAPLAVGSRSRTSLMRFNKFSVPGPLLAQYENQRMLAKKGKGMPLELMINCTATGLKADDDGVVRAIETSRGVLSWIDDNTKVVLCAGAIPNATLLLNSFDTCRKTVGKRLTGHFQSHIVARCPVENITGWTPNTSLEIAATYLAGQDPDTKRQYHIQITAMHSPNPEDDANDAARECPDYAAAATYEQLKDSKNHVVFVCASLGELNETNKDNFVQLDHKSKDPSTNVTLQLTLTKEDRKLWDTMDEATFQTIETMAGKSDGKKSSTIEYWDVKGEEWSKEKPKGIRVPGVVHEASTAFVGPQSKGGSLDDLYRPYDVSNVFVTGAALFPTAGSWNPTLTMCGFAQDLARKLAKKPGLIPPTKGDADIRSRNWR